MLYPDRFAVHKVLVLVAGVAWDGRIDILATMAKLPHLIVGQAKPACFNCPNSVAAIVARMKTEATSLLTSSTVLLFVEFQARIPRIRVH